MAGFLIAAVFWNVGNGLINLDLSYNQFDSGKMDAVINIEALNCEYNLTCDILF